MVPPLPTQSEFIKHLADLVCEGETLILARQKPLDGYFADGTPKATWPKYLPDADIKDGWAIYANTGAFIKSRLGKPISASAENCEHTLVMMLDDIGTKSKEPPLAPTWVMETSPGTFQWGYIFSEQPTKGAFAAAIRAIADAGFTDPGSCNPVRNFRVPGSVNLKQGRNRFRARLVSWNPEREFTLDEICEALGVTPGTDQTTGYRSMKIQRTNDEVLNWLSDNGRVISPPNRDGWAGIVCPNHEQHSDPTDTMARYNPNDRGFICYHGHCQHLTSNEFLSWVAEQGGPKVAHGVTEEDVDNKFNKAILKLGPPPEQNIIVEDIKAEQDIRDQRMDFFRRFAYLTDSDSFFDIDSREEFKRGVFNAMFRHIPCMSTMTGRRLEASVWFDENRNKAGGMMLKNVTYAPGERTLVEFGGRQYANKWVDARPVVDKTITPSVDRWLEHGRKLVPIDEEFEHVLNVMAFKLQHPDVKINHAILHAGREGCGKDTFWAPFIWAVCGPGYDNRGYLDSVTLNTPWGYHLESEVLLINELKEPTQAERRALANNLKPIIAAPPEFLEVNRKGLAPYKALNKMFVLAYSNSRSPISISSDDRRWFVVWSEARRMSNADGAAMWRWFKSGGFEEIAAWLYQRDVSAFNAGATPMESDYKQMLIDGGRSRAQAWLIDAVQSGQGEFAAGVVAAPFNRMADVLQGQAPDSVKIHHADIPEALQEAGWECLGKLHSREYNTKKQIWVSPEVNELLNSDQLSKTEVRQMAEKPVALATFHKSQLC